MQKTMSIKFHSDVQHIEVLQRLRDKIFKLKFSPETHNGGIEYTSLMNSFLLQNLSHADTLLHLLASFGKEWFPTTVGYVIVRPMFELDIHAHYISKQPSEYSKLYIDFEKITRYNQMMAVQKHVNSNNESWEMGMKFLWNNVWNPIQMQITEEYHSVISCFSKKSKSGKVVPFQNWIGKSTRQMSIEVDHEEAYDLFYSELSSFTHVDVNLANRFLRLNNDGITWTTKANQFDRGNVFRYASTFLTCFLELFGREFNTWTEEDIHDCWIVKI